MSGFAMGFARRVWTRQLVSGIATVAVMIASANVANASTTTMSDEDFDDIVASIAAVTADTAPLPPSDAGADAVADLLGDTAFDADLLTGLIDQTVALPDGVDLADGSVSVTSEEGDAASVTSGDLAWGLGVTFEVADATTVEAADGVIVAEGGASETYVGHTTAAGGQLIYVMADETADPTMVIDTEVPAGYAWVPTEGGGLSLMAEGSDAPLVVVAAPWARDANGTELDTSFSITQAGLVQHIDIAGATFPVVADPNWVWWAKEGAMCLGEIALFAVASAKVVAIGAKLVKFIGGLKATSKVAKAWATLGKDFPKFIKAVSTLLKILVNDGYSAVKSYIAQHSVEAAGWALLIGGGESIAGILGIGHCFNVVEEAL